MCGNLAGICLPAYPLYMASVVWVSWTANSFCTYKLSIHRGSSSLLLFFALSLECVPNLVKVSHLLQGACGELINQWYEDSNDLSFTVLRGFTFFCFIE